jgi:hypothetical protein
METSLVHKSGNLSAGKIKYVWEKDKRSRRRTLESNSEAVVRA